MRTIWIVLIITLLNGCSKPTETSDLPAHIQKLENVTVLSDLDPNGNVSFTETTTYGEIYMRLLPPQLGFGPEMAVDENGNVYRSDKGERTILVFNNEGELIHNVGRDGRGPGEFQSIVALDIAENQLKVFDSSQSRISTFSTSNFELLQTIPINATTWRDAIESGYLNPQTVIALNNDLYLTSLRDENDDGSFHQEYYKMNQEGQIVSNKIIETSIKLSHTGTTKQGYSTSIRPPYSTEGKISVSKDGQLFHINTGEFLIKKYDVDGHYLSSIYYPYQKEPLEKDDVLNDYHPNMHPVFDNAEFPETWPALESIIVDDEERTWVSTITEDKSVRQWYVLEESGEVVASFSWPRNSDIKMIRNNKMYAEETDQEAGIKVIVGYDLEFKE